MNEDPDLKLSKVAAAIAEPARSRMLCCLLDGEARTATELAIAAQVGASTASAHLSRLTEAGLLQVVAQSRHRYYRLAGENVARSLEALLIVADATPQRTVRRVPAELVPARTCYDHVAGMLGVQWHDRIVALGWLERGADANAYALSARGRTEAAKYGFDLSAPQRRRLAYPCLDWSERRAHVGGRLGAALLQLGLQRQWLRKRMDSRALIVTAKGRRELEAHFGIVPRAD
jgi:DNA-binding transcriptional ArsR family regulator